MAGTFATLMAGYITGMVHLGFALSFGILLDTFVIRPILVPSYLAMLHQGHFGELGVYMGAEPGVQESLQANQQVSDEHNTHSSSE